MNDTRTTRSARFDRTPIVVEDLGLIDYHSAWDLQRSIAAERAEGLGSDRLLLLEHPSVYTAGRRTEEEDLPIDGSPVVQVDRGGKITWHGPGQLVGYPIIRLAEPVDVVQYVRRLEEALISVCTDLGLTVGRVEGRSGVWLPANDWSPERKIAAIGVRVQRGVALHGLSFNCNSMDGFGAIVPCGIRDAGVTTLTRELGREVTVAEIKPLVADAIVRALDGDLPVSDHDIARATVRPPAEPNPATAAKAADGAAGTSDAAAAKAVDTTSAPAKAAETSDVTAKAVDSTAPAADVEAGGNGAATSSVSTAPSTPAAADTRGVRSMK
ncbi:lipoyl(octanoyl) transferase [Nocardia bhagyanarayanae]|uniref:Octanoyltransferase n=1 Tax=Nocardia bhagyanarayanae TaxID=1215925 RepID=A0A543EWP0_9NOCA|nr:lipoyl(octanoyl) transferase [Nocardia bhagyanarayanae]